MNKKTINMMIIYILLFLFVIFAVFPFLWMVSTSLKNNKELFTIPPTIIPSEFNFDSYMKILKESKFGLYFWNSIKVAGLTTVLAMSVSIMAGLGFSRFIFRGQNFLRTLLLVAQLFPLVLLVTPYYSIMSSLKLIDTHASLILAYASFTIPFSVWMLTNYFSALPGELEEAAMIDGCSQGKALIKVTIPLSVPGIVATAINSFILAWNEFLFANTFINSPTLRTLPIGLRSFMGEFSIEWNVLMAGSVICTIPVVIMFIFLQKKIVAGMTNGAVKG